MIYLVLAIISGLFVISYWPFWKANQFGPFDWVKDAFFYAVARACWQEYKTFPRHLYSFPENIEHFPSFQASGSWVSNPETPFFSPFFVCFSFRRLIDFWKGYVAAHLVVGVIGMYLLCNALMLDPISALLLCTLTLFSPWLMQHLAIGYSPWVASTYFPLMLWLMHFSPLGWYGSLVAGVFGALVLYEGGFHVFVWFAMSNLFVLGCYSILSFDPWALLATSLTLIVSAVLAAPRLVLGYFAYRGFERDLNTSYRNVKDILGLLTDRTTPKYELPKAYNIYNTAFYDSSFYVGWSWIAAVAAVLLIGTVSLFVNPSGIQQYALMISFALGGIFFLLLGVEGVWRKVVKRIPLLSCELYPCRFLAISGMLFSICFALFSHTLQGMYPLSAIIFGVFCALWLRSAIRENWNFSKVHSSGEITYDYFSLKDFWSHALRVATFPQQRKFAPTASPTSVEFIIEPHEIESQEIIVAWLQPGKHREFELSGGEFVVAEGYSLIKPSSSQVVLKPRYIPN